MDVFVASTGFCWGIDLAYQRISEVAGQNQPDGKAIGATHRAGGSPGWDPIRRIGAGDSDLIDRYPNLSRVDLVDDLDSLGGGEVVAIGHHGISSERIDAARARGAVVHDFTCPFIARHDKIAQTLVDEGYDLIAFGKPKNHHCLTAKEIAERGGRYGVIAEDAGMIEGALRDPSRNWACIGQVTGNADVWQRFQTALVALNIPVRIVDTICTDSYERQDEAVALAAKADIVVVVDDGGGATVSVFERCCAVNPNSFRYDPNQSLPVERFASVNSVAVVCGILVPKWVLDRVADDIRGLSRSNGGNRRLASY